MFSLLSTPCDNMAQQSQPCEHKRMVDKILNVAEKLDYIAKACGFTKKNELAKCIGVEPQNVENWRKRNSWTKDGTLRLSKATGVSMDWLNDLSPVAFPDGVKVKIAAPIAKRVERLEGDIDQARTALLSLVAVIDAKISGLAAAFHDELEDSAPSDGYAEKGFHGLLLAGVESLVESAAAEQAAARSRGVPARVGKKASK